MLRLTLLAGAALLSGCDFDPEKAFDLLSGREKNLVVLAKQPLVLTSEMAVFASQKPMKVVGELTSLCVSLKGGIPMQDSRVMDREFEDAMQSAQVNVTVVLANGERVALRQPLPAWSMYGKIVERDELSACASTPCKAELPVGEQVSRVEVSATPTLQVQGIYWESERAPLEKPAPQTAATAPKEKASCGP